MKKSVKLALVLSLCTLSALAAPAAQAKIRTNSRAQFAPLAGSAWAKEHPGLLPYEKCRIVDTFGTLSFVGSAVGIGVELGNYHALPRLLCWTKKLGLAFEIPVDIDAIQYVGLELKMTSTLKTVFGLAGLSGRTVDEIFDVYEGLNANLQIGLGGGYSYLANHYRVKLSYGRGTAGLGLGLGYTSLTLMRRSVIKSFECMLDDYMLKSGDTTLPYNTDACEAASQSTWIDMNGIGKLQFMKIER